MSTQMLNGQHQAGDIAAESEMLVLVDETDLPVGYMSKSLCHRGIGVLHRAFSLFILNHRGELLLQQRAPSKPLWPMFWSNSCCSHPRSAETMEAAIHRRLIEELGVRCPMQFLFKFQYRAQFDATHAEHELCSVYLGRCSTPLRINRREILAVRWISSAALQTEMVGGRAERFTPWFKLEWERVWREHRPALLALHPELRV
jgi:isopentenyl-diphosphate Delta-isomerase